MIVDGTAKTRLKTPICQSQHERSSDMKSTILIVATILIALLGTSWNAPAWGDTALDFVQNDDYIDLNQGLDVGGLAFTMDYIVAEFLRVDA